jgi:predicted 3-demethylubiquinone-9 3-methyltransferase (glyoxalase superfamily)
LKDRYGVSWQVIPRQLPEMLNGPDRAGAARVMRAMLQMTKIDVAKLEQAYDGVPVGV